MPHCSACGCQQLSRFLWSPALVCTLSSMLSYPYSTECLAPVAHCLLQLVVEPFLAEKELPKVLSFMRDMLVGMDSLHSGEAPDCCHRPACCWVRDLSGLALCQGQCDACAAQALDCSDFQPVEPTGLRAPCGMLAAQCVATHEAPAPPPPHSARHDVMQAFAGLTLI